MKDILVITDCPYQHWQKRVWDQILQPLNPRKFNLFHTAPQESVLKVMKMKGRKKCPKGYFLDANSRALPEAEYGKAKRKLDELLKIYPADSTILAPAGEFALHLLTGEVSVKDYRGSMMEFEGYNVLPLLKPDHLQLKASWRPFMIADRARLNGWRKGKIEPPSIEDAEVQTGWDGSFFSELFKLNAITCELIVDIETSDGEIDCIGLGVKYEADFFVHVIPFRDGSQNLHTHAEETRIISHILSLFRQTISFVGQNFSYDLAWLFEKWGFFPSPAHRIFDTMTAAHVLSPQQEKSLDAIASLYLASYRYWKTDHKGWKFAENGLQLRMNYNAQDIIYTGLIREVLGEKLIKEDLIEQFEFQGRSIKTLHRMTRWGSKVDEEYAEEVRGKLVTEHSALANYVKTATGLSYSQGKALGELFYDGLKLPEEKNKKTRRRSFDEEALTKLEKKFPEYSPVLSRILAARSIKIFIDNCNFPRAHDGRYRCGYNESGTDTFRLSSGPDPFGYGVNAQNITKGTKDGRIPNMRGMFVADDGYEGYEGDLKQADAQVVAADSKCERLLQIFREGLDLHDENAKVVYGSGIISHPNFQDVYRPRTKAGVHAANYGAHARTLATTLGITVKEAEGFMKTWFGANPEIKRWQDETIREFEMTRTLVNAFGFRVVWLGEINFHAHHFALSWRPQSTVAILTQKVAVAWEEELDHGDFQTQFQTHDSLRFLVRKGCDSVLQRAKEIAASIPVPYSPPLYIGWDYERCPRWGQKMKEEG